MTPQIIPPVITGNFTLIADPTTWQRTTNEKVQLNVDTTLGPVNITLPKISDLNGFNNVKIFVADLNNTAGTNPINILPAPLSTDKVSGQATGQIATNGGAAIIQVADSDNWEFDAVGESAGPGMLYGMHNLLAGIILSPPLIDVGGFISIQPSALPVMPFEVDGPGQSGANHRVFNGASSKFKRLLVRTYDNTCNVPVEITLRKNGVDTLIKTTIPPLGIGDFTDIANEVASNGLTDEFCLKFVKSPASPPAVGNVFVNQYQIWLK